MLALRHLRPGEADAATAWVRASLTSFATSVASIVPGGLPTYARVYHPFDERSTWREHAEVAGRTLDDPADAADFALHGVPSGQARVGTLPLPLVEILLEHLGPETAPDDACYFAVWEGFGDSVMPVTVAPTLALPHRNYHVFTGPLIGARTSFSSVPWAHQSANLWWPARHQWCVATEIDHAWTYIGAPRPCIDAILADARLEARETSAHAKW